MIGEQLAKCQAGNYPLTVGTPREHHGGAWRTRYTENGSPYQAWERQMPRIRDELLECVIYLYPSVATAQAGERTGGSGFLLTVPFENRRQGRHLYAVTCSHVIREGNSPVVRLNTVDGKTDVIDLQYGEWIHHPDGDDLAVCPLSLAVNYHKYRPISESLLLTKDIIKKNGLGPGEDVILIGRFIQHDGKQRNLVSIRFGNVAMMPGEPVKHPRGHMQESFLVETRSLAGYSGSPILVHRLGMMWPAAFGKIMQARPLGPWLLGVDWGHLPIWEKVRDRDGNELSGDKQGWKVPSNSGIMGVVPAWRLRDLLYCEELMESRKKREKDLADDAAVLDVAQEESEPPFTKSDFENALRKVSRRVQPSQSGEEK